MSTVLDHFSEIDAAYNRQDWAAYTALFARDASSGQLAGQNHKAWRSTFAFAKVSSTVFRDNKVMQTPHIVAFIDGEWTCTIARLSGTRLNRLTL